MSKNIFFVSDAHLGADDYRKEKIKQERLLTFLEFVQHQAESVYIVGDLFDFWFEYGAVVPDKHHRIIHKLWELVDANVKIVYLAGNHDYWMGSFFPNQIGIEISKQPVVVELQGKKFFIAHGDGYAHPEFGYCILRTILRNPVNILLYKLIPPNIGIPIAHFSSRLSRTHSETKSYVKPMKVLTQFAKTKFDEGFDAVVTGHIHQPYRWENHGKTFLCIGDWIKHFSYGRLTDGKLLLEKWE